MSSASPTPPARGRHRWIVTGLAALSTRRRWIVTGLAALAAVVAAVWGFDWLAYRFTHSISKDAFIESHLINLAPQVPGNIVEVFVQEQDLVKEGQLLARIDPSTYQRELDLAEAKSVTAQAALAKAEADLAVLIEEVPKRVTIAEMRLAIAREDERKAGDALEMITTDTDKGVTAAQRTVDGARATFALAQEDFTRYQALFKDGSVSERKYQEATKGFKTAKADVQVAEAKLAQAEANRKQASIAGQQLRATQHAVAEATAVVELAKVGNLQIVAARQLVTERLRQVAEARRAVELAQVNFSYTRVVAPYDGIIAKKWRHLGDYARAGDPIFSVYNPELLYVTVNLEETLLEGVNPGNYADLRIDAFRQPFRGRVVWLGSATGANFSLIPRDISSGEFTYVVQRVPTRILIERDERWKFLKPGLSVTAAIEHGSGDAVWAAQANRQLAQIMGLQERKP
jgi:membrane fusion protein (multidrug efflux system)